MSQQFIYNNFGETSKQKYLVHSFWIVITSTTSDNNSTCNPKHDNIISDSRHIECSLAILARQGEKNSSKNHCLQTEQKKKNVETVEGWEEDINGWKRLRFVDVVSDYAIYNYSSVLLSQEIRTRQPLEHPPLASHLEVHVKLLFSNIEMLAASS